VSTSTFVAMQRQGALFGIHAQIVQAIVADRDWKGAEPFDVSQALEIAPAAEGTAHPVLLIGAAERTSPLRALGAVLLRQVEVSSVWPVPLLARHPAKRQTVSGIAFVEQGVPLLVLDPVALLAMIEERATP
jgi:hypothetical protein